MNRSVYVCAMSLMVCICVEEEHSHESWPVFCVLSSRLASVNLGVKECLDLVKVLL